MSNASAYPDTAGRPCCVGCVRSCDPDARDDPVMLSRRDLVLHMGVPAPIKRITQQVDHRAVCRSLGIVSQLESERHVRPAIELDHDFRIELIVGGAISAGVVDSEEHDFPLCAIQGHSCPLPYGYP